jgi:hypothetical protein
VKKQKTERIDDLGNFRRIHNESRYLPDHEQRMKAHCKRVKKEDGKTKKTI